VDLLREGIYGELAPRQVKPVERIEASASSSASRRQVLDLAKMAAGRLEIHTETTIFARLFSIVASEIESLVSERVLHLSLVMGALFAYQHGPDSFAPDLVNLLGMR